ncbi:MAG: (2Fe-2S)-binding protein [Actinobacteria bacterium]|nr:(2Fe-2S)-binding protein [Actinomycetota bacterium]
MGDKENPGGRVGRHPVLDKFTGGREVVIFVDGEPLSAREGEPVAAALYAAGRRVTRYARHTGEPRGPFCMIGLCAECCMTVDGVSNVRTCRIPVREGMRVDTPERSSG